VPLAVGRYERRLVNIIDRPKEERLAATGLDRPEL